VGKKSTWVFQFSAPARHHPTETLETMRFGMSNVPGAFWGPRYRRWKIGHLGLAACPKKLLDPGLNLIQNRTMTCMVDRPAVYIHLQTPK
jgi:hypothetical protein